MDEIKLTRKGNIGSSDANLIYKLAVDKNYRSLTLQDRIEVLLGKKVPSNFSNEYTDFGNKMELEFYNQRLKENPLFVISNPLYKSELIRPKHFSVITHIDVEEITNNTLIWYECKTVFRDKTAEEIQNEYIYQLQWHHMLLEERVKQFTDIGSKVILVIYFIDKKDFSVINIVNKEISRDETIISTLKKGIDVLDEIIENNSYSLNVENSSDEIEQSLKELLEVELKINELKDKQTKLKEDVLNYMRTKNVKKLSKDNFDIVYTGKSTYKKLNTQKLKVDYPDLISKYEEEVEKSDYITIKMKNIDNCIYE